MEKVIRIDEVELHLKSTGATAKRYKAQFARDLLSDILKLNVLNKIVDNETGKLKSDLKDEDLNKIDFDLFENIVWVFAKTASPQTVKDPLTWLDSFETFPILDILPEVTDMLLSSLSKKNSR